MSIRSDKPINIIFVYAAPGPLMSTPLINTGQPTLDYFVCRAIVLCALLLRYYYSTTTTTTTTDYYYYYFILTLFLLLSFLFLFLFLSSCGLRWPHPPSLCTPRHPALRLSAPHLTGKLTRCHHVCCHFR